ncbi:MAG: LON peptidase substrate-binding domain-containing protein, partial [Anaerolineales bacterium]|nr:LON peptidase substrate-binding domain-containing protein [Anaerolineales bacterium]
MSDNDMDRLLEEGGFLAVSGRRAEGIPQNLGETIFEQTNEIAEYPLLPLRDTVIFPHMVTPLFVGRDRSLKAVEAAMSTEGTIVVVAQKDVEMEEPSPDDIYTVGTEMSIIRMWHLPDGTTNIWGKGTRRVEILDFVHVDPYIKVRVRNIVEPSEKTLSTQALMRAVLALFEKCVQLDRNLPEDAYVIAMNIDEPGWLADLVASALNIDIEKRQEVLETIH